jgi:hypothetical protein
MIDFTITGKRDFRRDASIMYITILLCLWYARKLNEHLPLEINAYYYITSLYTLFLLNVMDNTC